MNKFITTSPNWCTSFVVSPEPSPSLAGLAWFRGFAAPRVGAARVAPRRCSSKSFPVFSPAPAAPAAPGAPLPLCWALLCLTTSNLPSTQNASRHGFTDGNKASVMWAAGLLPSTQNASRFADGNKANVRGTARLPLLSFSFASRAFLARGQKCSD